MNIGIPKLEFVQLLYFLSGFLSLQLEIQNFLSMHWYGGPHIKTDVFRDSSSVPKPSVESQHIADKIFDAITPMQIYDTFRNISKQVQLFYEFLRHKRDMRTYNDTFD